MLLTFSLTALFMGVVGGPHCLVMCAAPCAALVNGCSAAAVPGSSAAAQGEGRVRWLPNGFGGVQRLAAFHLGRLAGYALAGALAALAMDGLAWMTQQTAALRPVWTLMHVAILVWGLAMVLQARQPAWVESAGRAVWRRMQSWTAAPVGLGLVGVLWALMPCSLLYSALLVAALSGGVWQGAWAMALFGIGSGVWLLAGPWIWGQLRSRLNAARADWGTRLAGLLLCAMAGWALWMDVIAKSSLWCA